MPISDRMRGGDIDLKIVVHLPSESKLKEFQKDIVDIQVSMIVLRLNSLSVSNRNKKKILKELIEEI